MKTNQILKRDFMGMEVRQEHKTRFFNVNDFTKVANTYRKSKGLAVARFDRYIRTHQTQEFLNAIMEEENIAQVIKSTRGKDGSTWAHPLVFLDYAMWISPELKVKVYKWIYDNLAEFRDSSGDSYKVLTGVMQSSYPRLTHQELRELIQSLARAIKQVLKVEDWNCATEEQLRKRDTIHKNLQMLIKAGVDLQKAFNLSIENIDTQAA